MMVKLIKSLMIIITVLATAVTAQAQSVLKDETSGLEEINPFDPNIEQLLQKYDQEYEKQTGQPAHLDPSIFDILFDSGCFRFSCPVYIQVVKSTQLAYLYRDGQLTATWKVSTGMSGYRTPNFDRHPNGRIYDKFSSSKYPGGDYNGLGNMPYAVFIEGGFAIHGTPQANWNMLGRRASHGCIRLHPDNGYIFNRLVRQYGISNTWFTVQN